MGSTHDPERPRVPGAAEQLTAGDRAAASLPWLARLRWGAVAGQLATVLVARWAVGVVLPLAPLLACIATTATTNLWLERVLRRGTAVSPRLAGVLLTFDTLVLTVILHLTGGSTNPFSIVYLVHITLAAVMLDAAWTWGLAALAASCYGLLFLATAPTAVLHHGADFHAHLHGMWVAFAVAAGLTAYFVVQLRAAIERRDAELAAIRAVAARNERLAALTTLAAGAAHELGSPLATIAVAATELERRLARLPHPDAPALHEDAQLIRAELERCRHILDHMAARSGDARGEAPARVPARALVDDVLGELPAEDRGRVRIEVTASEPLAVPRRALGQAIGNLVRNALDAAPPPRRVELRVEPTAGGLRIAVRDEGPGMAAETLARAGEPFFSTKPAGRGMGLGLFLTRAVAEQMGGRLALESRPGHGATATIELPVAAARPAAG